MPDMMSQGIVMFYFLLRHTFRMMYWVVYPGVIISGLISLRFQQTLREKVRKNPDHGTKTIVLASLLGLTSSAGRKRSLGSGLELFAEGLSGAGFVAYLVATHTLVIYALTLMLVLLGLEFAVGQLLGAVFMIALMSLAIRVTRAEDVWQSQRSAAQMFVEQSRNSSAAFAGSVTPAAWRGITSPATWLNLLRYLAGELRALWLSLGLGYLIGGFLLVAGLQSWWIDLATVGGGGLASDVNNVLLAPFMSMLTLASPLGNLPMASNLFKTYTLTYPGVVTFVLASLLNPRSIRIYLRVFGRKLGWRLMVSLFVCAILSGLLVTGTYALFGFRPGHVPLFRELVDKIIMWLPFTMPPMGMPKMMN